MSLSAAHDKVKRLFQVEVTSGVLPSDTDWGGRLAEQIVMNILHAKQIPRLPAPVIISNNGTANVTHHGLNRDGTVYVDLALLIKRDLDVPGRDHIDPANDKHIIARVVVANPGATAVVNDACCAQHGAQAIRTSLFPLNSPPWSGDK